MNNGYLSQYFESVAAKKLSAVEINTEISHQHEFNGSRELRRVLGTERIIQFPTKFLWLEEQNSALSENGSVTWYDARENHPKRSEFRLYFSANSVMSMAVENDTLFIAKRTDGTLLIIIAVSGTTIESQLYWLFGIAVPEGNDYGLSEIDKTNDHALDFATRFILDELGIEVEEPENDRLDSLLDQFDNRFPSTAIFSKFARESLGFPVNEIEDPDHALISFMDWEEKLFRRLERHIVASRLHEGFHNGDFPDIDGFITFSLSVQNRRKSRVGYAFEDHLSEILQKNDLKFARKAETENKAKPDFLFPGIEFYRDPLFPADQLTMLGTKTTCKDRWRQLLSEAAKIPEKHLLTLEPGISENQTTEMRSHNIQLILPQAIHQTYSIEQQDWLLNLKEFISLVDRKQR